MIIGMVGVKCGMTRIFDQVSHCSIPVSVVQLKPNRIVQLKTCAQDGYSAVQVGFGISKPGALTKAVAGHYAKAQTVPGIGLFEFRLDPQSVATLNVGAELTLEQFQEGQKVDVTGTTRGHGTTGTVKRYNFKMQPASHGNSLSHRRPGSIGQNQSPGRVFKGKKMSGRDGNSQRTIQNLSVIRVDIERQVLLIEGAIPGAPGSRVVVYPAVKKPMAVAVGGRT